MSTGYYLTPETNKKLDALLNTTGGAAPSHHGSASQPYLCWVNTEGDGEGIVQNYDPVADSWVEYGSVFLMAADGSDVPAGRHLCRMSGKVDRGTEEEPDIKPLAIATLGGSGSSNCGWTVGLRETDCLVVSAPGSSDVFLSYTTPAYTGGALIICENPYDVTLANDACHGPCLTLTVGMSESYTGMRSGCSCGELEFAFSRQALCGGEREEGAGPCDDVVTVSVAHGPCPVDGFISPGYYCARPEEGNCLSDGTAVYLSTEDATTTDLVICSGPYDSEGEAESACDPEGEWIDVPCDDSDVFSVLYASFSGTCGSMGTVTLTYDIGEEAWLGTYSGSPCGNIDILFDPCAGGGAMTFTGPDTSSFGAFTTLGTGDPIVFSPMYFHAMGSLLGDCSGVSEVVVTDVAP